MRASASSMTSGAFWKSIRPTVPTTVASCGQPEQRARARAREAGDTVTEAGSTAGPIVTSWSGRTTRRRSASTATPVPTAR